MQHLWLKGREAGMMDDVSSGPPAFGSMLFVEVTRMRRATKDWHVYIFRD